MQPHPAEKIAVHRQLAPVLTSTTDSRPQQRGPPIQTHYRGFPTRRQLGSFQQNRRSLVRRGGRKGGLRTRLLEPRLCPRSNSRRTAQVPLRVRAWFPEKRTLCKLQSWKSSRVAVDLRRDS